MKYKIAIIGLCICSIIQGQSIFYKETVAEKEFNRFNYPEAIILYLQVITQKPDDIKLVEHLAESYRQVNDGENAALWYGKLVGLSPEKPENYLFLAQALSRSGDYINSAKNYQKYADFNLPDVIKASEFVDAYNNLSPFYVDSSKYTLRKSFFNSEYSDFSPMYYGSEIAFVSARKKTEMIHQLYNWTQSSFLDIYLTDSLLAKPFSSKINTRFHEGPMTFNSKQDTIIFTRSNYYRMRLHTDKEGINKLKLYIATWDSRRKSWEKTSPLPFNNNNYSVGHPAFSPDGKTLYFVSDMPGGIGETDIYKIELNKNTSTGKAEWGVPQNLGDGINTSGKEMFPYPDSNGNLYFASNGRPGLGGLDIFKATSNGKDGFEKAENQGSPVNTRYDDFGFICDSSGMSGYLSSDRNNAYSDDNIYYWTKNESQSTTINAPPIVKDPVKIPVKIKIPAPVIKFEGRAINAGDKKPVADAFGLLTEKNENSKIEALCDKNGVFSFILKAEADYNATISVRTPGSSCSSDGLAFSTKGILKDTTIVKIFEIFCVGDIIKIDNIYYDLNKYNIRPDATKELDKLLGIMNKYPNMKIELRSHTDSRGSDVSNMVLSENRAKSATSYLVSKGISSDRITAKGYGETLLINKCGNGVICTEQEHQINRRTEFKILSMDK